MPATIHNIRAESFGIDDENNLYMDGKPVAVQRKLTLTDFQRNLALALSIVTIFATVPSGLVSILDVGCRFKVWSGVCAK